MITVLIPTAKRPDLLANALRSVAEQTALNDIIEIIVSESAGDSRSREVCKKFPELPIKYILRDPQLQMVEHFSALQKARWSGDYIAILHDDDWWAPEHLSTALTSLRARPQAVAYCSNSYYIPSEKSLLKCSWTMAFWFSLNYPELRGIWELNVKEVMLGLLIEMPATCSSMVIRAEILPEAAVVYDSGNRWDADVMLLCELAARGPVLFCPFPHVFYRQHPQQMTNMLDSQYRLEQMLQTNEWMIHRSGETWESASQLFCERFLQCPPEALESLRAIVMKPSCLPLLAAHSNPGTPIALLYLQLKEGERRKHAYAPLLHRARNLLQFFRK